MNGYSFSNAAFYQNRLEAPRPARPVSPDGNPALFLEHVDGVYQTTRTNPQEARRVVAYLSGLWSEPGPHPTIGVVTFNDAQREAIEDLLDAHSARDAGFRAAYGREVTRTQDGQGVGFFVKSLEAVQGDERDVILFSTTYGHREDGSFNLSFLGPINKQGGERRLNVAVTRARLWVRIFTSLRIAELGSALSPGVLEPREAAGRASLQLYLAYAEAVSGGNQEAAEGILRLALDRGGRDAVGEPVGQEESEFEVEVHRSLEEHLGLEIDTQVSSGAFRIDLGVRDAGHGGYILGIECDGKAYHSAPSARAYDHWRQSVLEQRGWHIHRIWSTAWRTNRVKEIEKIEEVVSGLLQAAASSGRRDQ